jgi:hypothetical protein
MFADLLRADRADVSRSFGPNVSQGTAASASIAYTTLIGAELSGPKTPRRVTMRKFINIVATLAILAAPAAILTGAMSDAQAAKMGPNGEGCTPRGGSGPKPPVVIRR